MSSNSALAIKTGAITLSQISLIFFGTCSFEHNAAENGAAIHSSESRIQIIGGLKVTGNNARKNGGGILLHQSELICQSNSHLTMIDNVAMEKGGAIYASGSTLKITAWIQQTLLTIRNNSAKNGGGLYLETSAKIIIVKYSDSYSNLVNFTGNSADYGGAVFVDDDTLSAACTRGDIDYFIQDLILLMDEEHKAGNSVSLELNHARVQGSNLFGGLLHRCAIRAFTVFGNTIMYTNATLDGLSYYNRISNSSLNKVSSHPINICQCIDNTLNCTMMHHPSHRLKKGGLFSVSLVAVNQIGHPVAATIQSLLSSNKSGLLEGQSTISISAKCTNLEFNVVSPEDSEQLSLYASNGPCKNAESGSLIVDVIFLPCSCPVGFQNSENSEVNCTCECHIDITPYVSRCDIHTQSIENCHM